MANNSGQEFMVNTRYDNISPVAQDGTAAATGTADAGGK
jgi:hypothetical protein